MMAIWARTLPKEARPPLGGLMLRVAALDDVVDLHGSLGDEEQAAAEEHQVLSGDLQPEDGEQRCDELHHPGDPEEEQNPEAHGEEQPDLPGLLLFRGFDLRGEDRQEDDVVDAENDLERGQREERGEAAPAQQFGGLFDEDQGCLPPPRSSGRPT